MALGIEMSVASIERLSWNTWPSCPSSRWAPEKT
jgi:hypothetical protein